MTTSSDHRSPAPRPSGEHWFELTATLSRESTAEFGDWLRAELDLLEAELHLYVTRNSRRKSLHRQ